MSLFLISIFTLSTFFSLVEVTAVGTGSDALFILENSTATFFYDLDAANSRCAGRGGGGDGTLSNVPNCENNGPTIGQLNTNRIVALNETLLKGDMSAWCGKEVKIYQSNQEVVFDEPLVVWGTCGACSTESKFDLSVDAYLKLMPGENCFANDGNNPGGFRLEIVDNQIWEPAPGSASYSPVPASTVHSGGGYGGQWSASTGVVPPWKNGPVVGVPGGAVQSSVQVTATGVPEYTNTQGAQSYSQPGYTQSAPSQYSMSQQAPSQASYLGSVSQLQPVAPTGPAANFAQPSAAGGCQKGNTRCVGTDMQICNYITNDGSGPVWTHLNACPGGCNVSQQPACRQ